MVGFLGNILILLASYAIQAIFAPTPEGPKPGTLDDFSIAKITEGTPMSVVVGTVRKRDPQVLLIGRLTTKAIKAKGGKK